MKILAVDPHVSKPYAWSKWEDGILIRFGKARDMKELSPEISWCDVVFVEDQYLNKNFKTAKSLSWSAGKIMGVAELFGKGCEEMNVATWKGGLGLMSGTKEPPKVKVERMVTMAKTMAITSPMQNQPKIDEDLASAILIGLYSTRVLG